MINMYLNNGDCNYYKIKQFKNEPMATAGDKQDGLQSRIYNGKGLKIIDKINYDHNHDHTFSDK